MNTLKPLLATPPEWSTIGGAPLPGPGRTPRNGWVSAPELALSRQVSTGKLLAKTRAALEQTKDRPVTGKRTHMVFVLDASSSMPQGKDLTMPLAVLLRCC